MEPSLELRCCLGAAMPNSSLTVASSPALPVGAMPPGARSRVAGLLSRPGIFPFWHLFRCSATSFASVHPGDVGSGVPRRPTPKTITEMEITPSTRSTRTAKFVFRRLRNRQVPRRYVNDHRRPQVTRIRQVPLRKHCTTTSVAKNPCTTTIAVYDYLHDERPENVYFLYFAPNENRPFCTLRRYNPESTPVNA